MSKSGSTAVMLEENAKAAGTHTAGRGDTSRQAQPNALVLVGKSREKSGMPPRASQGPPGSGAGLWAERSLSCIAPIVWRVWEPDYRVRSAPSETNKGIKKDGACSSCHPLRCLKNESPGDSVHTQQLRGGQLSRSSAAAPDSLMPVWLWGWIYKMPGLQGGKGKGMKSRRGGHA